MVKRGKARKSQWEIKESAKRTHSAKLKKRHGQGQLTYVQSYYRVRNGKKEYVSNYFRKSKTSMIPVNEEKTRIKYLRDKGCTQEDAANQMGYSVSTLKRKLKKYGISWKKGEK